MITIKTYYIKEDDKPNILKKIINYIKVQDTYIIIQPIKSNNKRIHKTTKQIKKICTKNMIKGVVISKNLQKNIEFLNYIYAHNLNTFDGRWLINYMAYEVVDYIVTKKNCKKEETEISILVNNVTNEITENIKLFAKEYKRINIVTRHINEFKYLEKKIYDEFGMMITLTNNKRKSLEKSKLILNFNFSNELINQYNIYEKAIIINFKNNIKIKKKRFNGICVNNFEVTSVHENDDFEMDKINCFYLKDLLEAKLYRKDSFNSIRLDILKRFYKIKALYGANGRVFL